MSMTAIMCLTAALYFETRGEDSVTGQVAVATVIMNRVDSPRWPSTVCGVVNQAYQFSYTHDGISDNPYKHAKKLDDKEALQLAELIAKLVLSGERLDLTSTHYHATYVSPTWANHYSKDAQYGKHIFYTAPKGL
jgi:spore germination cell wall hydrolase CwlJ-like protein